MSRKPVPVNRESGSRLKALLVSSGKKQIELAKILSCQPQHVSNIVCGKRRLTPDMAQDLIDKLFPDIRIEWLLCKDNFMTEADKVENSKEMWEEGHKSALFYDKIFKLFIDGIESICGYGLHSQGVDILIGEFIAVTDKAGKSIGVVTVESFGKLQDEVEHYASYLIHLLIENEMMDIPITKNGGGCDG